MKIKGAIFDLDGTLLESVHVWRQLDVDFLGKHGYETPGDYADVISAMSFQEAAEYTVQRFSLSATPTEVMEEWNQMAKDAYAKEVPLKQGTRRVLDWFARQGIPMGVATSNISILYEPCLKRNGVYDYFESFTETQEVGKGKEFPDIYITESKKLRCRPEECLVFEDIIPALKAARAGGFVSIGVWEPGWGYNRDEFEACCDYGVDEIGAALTLLNSLK